MLYSLLFSIGIITASYFSVLPPLIPSIAFLVILAFAIVLFKKKYPHRIRFYKYALFGASLVAGVIYGICAGHAILANELPDDFAGKDFIVEGRVVGLPQEDNRHQLFSFLVDSAALSSKADAILKSFPKKINLSSFDNLRVKPGERWRLKVKLKPPRGFVNPGGFDYQVSLLRRGVGATGYIRSGESQLLNAAPSFSMDVFRYQLQQWLINTSHSSERGILIALLVGDTSFVDKTHWAEMLKTGTNHLIAISGLHLGFFAIAGFLIGNFIGRFVQLVWFKCPSMVFGYILSVTFTTFYSLVAGMNIPTLRTLIMLIVMQSVFVWRRHFSVVDVYFFALLLVLLYDPLAAYDIGFWLSFGAVGMLIFCFAGRLSVVKNPPTKIPFFAVCIEFIKSQWVMFIGLLVPLAVLVHTSTLLAPLANLIAIPVMTFFVVPCLIFAAIFHCMNWVGESFFLGCAEWAQEWVQKWLHYLVELGNGHFNFLFNLNLYALPLAGLSVAFILLPQGLRQKWIGFCGLVLAICIPLKNISSLNVLVFDVGQGTAVLVRTAHHQLLYDTGPKYTENFDAGSGIIVPYLQSQSLNHLDMLVVSHNDQDHSGGMEGVLAANRVDKLLLGEPEKYNLASQTPLPQNCHEQPSWEWDDVQFEFITWSIDSSDKANNHSCVLLVSYQDKKILLTGDIEKAVEQQLLNANKISAVDILLAPHHGSHTSSTQEFVNQAHPNYVVYSAGFHNQHGHPHRDVQTRYQAINSQELNTAFSGALEFSWQPTENAFEIKQYRSYSEHFWFSQAK